MISDRNYFDAFLIFSKTSGTSKLIFENILDKMDHLLEDIQKLCYPGWMGIENSEFREFFFVLEDTIFENVRRFCFCTQWRNRFNNNLEVYCIVSQNNWRKEFHGLCSIFHSQRIIENIKAITENDLRNLNQFVERFSRTQFPEPGKEGIFFFRGSNPHLEVKLAFTKPHFNNTMFKREKLLKLCTLCDSSHILTLFASALIERTVVFISRDYTKVFECICALQSLLIPFKWQYDQIPLVPNSMEEKVVEMKRAILGVHSSSVLVSKFREREDVVMFDLDRKELVGGVDINFLFPRRVLENMFVKLQKILPKPGSSEFNDGSVQELFLKFLVDIFVTYRNYLTKRGSTFTFNQSGFVKDNPQQNNNFLMELFECKTFKVFIEERIRMKRDGVFKICPFEERCSKIIPTLYGISLYGKPSAIQKVKSGSRPQERKGSRFGKFIGLGKSGLLKKGKGWLKGKGGAGLSKAKVIQHPSHIQQQPAHLTKSTPSPGGGSPGFGSGSFFSSASSSSSSFGLSGGVGSSGSGMSAARSFSSVDRRARQPDGSGGTHSKAMRIFSDSLSIESPQTEYSKKLRRLDKSFSVLHEEATPDQILEGSLLDLPKEEVMFPSEISSRTELFNEVIQRQEKRIAQLLDISFDDVNQDEERREEEKEKEELKDLYQQLQKLNKEL